MAQAADPSPTFRGASRVVQSVTDRAWMLAGPSETSKTWATIWRLDTLLRQTPKAQATLIRKVQADIYGTVLVTYERLAALRGMPPAFGGEKPQWYDYPNGARLWVGGLDNADKVLSGERDFIYVNQAEQITEDDWETLTTRATGRGAVSPTPMVFGDCNPGPEDHWIIRRRDTGALRFLESRHEDNPALYDEPDSGVFVLTEQGRRTLQTLDALTGVRYQRLRLGRWVGAEGQFFSQLNETEHVIPDITLPFGWSAWGALDYGFHHPLSFGLFAQAPDGRIVVLGRHSAHKWYLAQHAAAMDDLLALCGVPKRGLRIVAGHDCWATGKDDPETIADKLAALGYPLERAIISRVAGWRAVGERLGNRAAGVPITLQWCARARADVAALARLVHDPRNPEDVLKVNADAEGRGGDDDGDRIRYGVMAAGATAWTPDDLAKLAGRRV